MGWFSHWLQWEEARSSSQELLDEWEEASDSESEEPESLWLSMSSGQKGVRSSQKWVLLFRHVHPGTLVSVVHPGTRASARTSR